MTTRVETAAELAPLIGQELGISTWRAVTEAEVLRFAELTGDRHWLHTDPVRAARETPFGGVVAHGFLTLSLLTAMVGECLEVRAVRRWSNYGLDRLRFTHPVLPGDRLRARLTLTELTPDKAGATRLRIGCTMEIEARPRPALVTDFIMVAHA
jgi:acyl dehydratase